jgi:hypothetical protein
MICVTSDGAEIPPQNTNSGYGERMTCLMSSWEEMNGQMDTLVVDNMAMLVTCNVTLMPPQNLRESYIRPEVK